MDLIPPLGTLLRLIPTLLEESETWIHLPVYVSEKKKKHKKLVNKPLFYAYI
jgi:hypothetical protein